MDFLLKTSRNKNHNNNRATSPQRQRRGGEKLPSLRKSESPGYVSISLQTLDLDGSSSSFKYPFSTPSKDSDAARSGAGSDDRQLIVSDSWSPSLHNNGQQGSDRSLNTPTLFLRRKRTPSPSSSNYYSSSTLFHKSDSFLNTKFAMKPTTRRRRSRSPSIPFQNLLLRRNDDARQPLLSSSHSKSGECLDYSHNIRDDDDDSVSLPRIALLKTNQACSPRSALSSKHGHRCKKIISNNSSGSPSATPRGKDSTPRSKSDGCLKSSHTHGSKHLQSLNAEKKTLSSIIHSSSHKSDGYLNFSQSTHSSSETVRRRNHLQGEDIDQRLERRLLQSRSINKVNDEKEDNGKVHASRRTSTRKTKQRSRSASSLLNSLASSSSPDSSPPTLPPIQQSGSTSRSWKRLTTTTKTTLEPTLPFHPNQFRRPHMMAMQTKSTSLRSLKSRNKEDEAINIGEETTIVVPEPPTPAAPARRVKSTGDLKDQKQGISTTSTRRVKNSRARRQKSLPVLEDSRRRGLGSPNRGATTTTSRSGTLQNEQWSVPVATTTTDTSKTSAETGKEKRRYGLGSFVKGKRRGRRSASRSFSPPRVITDIEHGRHVVEQAMESEEAQQIEVELLEKGRPSDEMDEIRCQLAFKNDLAKIDELSLKRQHYDEKQWIIKEEMTKKYEKDAQKRSWEQLIIQKEIFELENENKDLSYITSARCGSSTRMAAVRSNVNN